MDGNPFFIKPAGDIGQGLAGLGQIINQRQMQDREIGIQDAELKRQEDKRRAYAETFGIDPDTGQPVGVEAPAEEYVPKISPSDMLDSIMDPRAAKYEESALAEMGIAPDKYDEVKEFSNKFLKAPPEERRQLAMDRIKAVTERGGDARDTAKLLMMPKEEADKVLNVVDLIVSRQGIRKLAAIDPIATQKLLSAGSGEESAKVQSKFVTDNGTIGLVMRNGDIKDTGQKVSKDFQFTAEGLVFDPKTGSMSKPGASEGMTTEEYLREQQRIRDVENKDLSTKEKIKADADLMRQLNSETLTESGKADLAKKHMENSMAQTAKEMSDASVKDSISLVDEISAANLDSIYGKGEKYYPELLRSQKGIDLVNKRNRLINTIIMGSRSQLKGQGTVSDADLGMLTNAASILGNPNISADAAREELARIRPILQRALGGSTAAPSQSGSKRLRFNPATGMLE